MYTRTHTHTSKFTYLKFLKFPRRESWIVLLYLENPQHNKKQMQTSRSLATWTRLKMKRNKENWESIYILCFTCGPILTLYLWSGASPATRNEFDPDCWRRYSRTFLAFPTRFLRASAWAGSSWLGEGFRRTGPRGLGGRLPRPPGLGGRCK